MMKINRNKKEKSSIATSPQDGVYANERKSDRCYIHTSATNIKESLILNFLSGHSIQRQCTVQGFRENTKSLYTQPPLADTA